MRDLPTEAVETRQPRHSVDEVAAIFAAFPQGDPALRLLEELAAEFARAVTARRSMRAFLREPDRPDWTKPRKPVPQRIPPGRGKRKPRQRERCRGFVGKVRPERFELPTF